MVYLKITDRYDMTSSIYRAHTAFYNGTNRETTKTDIVFGLFEALRPGKQFFSHVGTEPPLPGYYQYFFGGGGMGVGKYTLLKDTTWRLKWGSNPRPLDPESEVLTTRPPRPQKILWYRRSYFIGSMIIICLLL